MHKIKINWLVPGLIGDILLSSSFLLSLLDVGEAQRESVSSRIEN